MAPARFPVGTAARILAPAVLVAVSGVDMSNSNKEMDAVATDCSVLQVEKVSAGAPSREESSAQSGFLDFKGLCKRLPLGARTLRTEIKRGRIPHIRLPGGRRLLFDWETGRANLLRHQRGGAE